MKSFAFFRMMCTRYISEVSTKYMLLPLKSSDHAARESESVEYLLRVYNLQKAATRV